MSTHLFAIGETVSLNFHEGSFFSKLDSFVIEAQMPPIGSHLQYRIKSKSELCRRVVAEHQLSLFGSQPQTEPTIFVGPNRDITN